MKGSIYTESVAGATFSRESKTAYRDICDGLRSHNIWITLVRRDFRLMFKRTKLGPIWIVINTFIRVFFIGLIFSSLTHKILSDYLFYLGSGYIAWHLISGLLKSSCDVFIKNAQYITNIKLPYSSHVIHNVSVNLVQYFYQFLIWAPCYLVGRPDGSHLMNILLIFPGLAVIAFNGFFFGLFIGVLSARYRDLKEFFSSFIQILFFVTPVIWVPEHMTFIQQLICDVNPLYPFLEMLRAFMQGLLPPLYCVELVILYTIINVFLGFITFSRFRSKIVFWV